MINHNQLREFIIRPTLNEFGMYSLEAEELLIATCANESLGGTYLKQIKGPALGIYQMEPETHNDIWLSYLFYNPGIKLKVYESFNINWMAAASSMVYDLKYATLMARLFYYRIKEKLPDSNNIESMFRYYKEYYNTINGKATMFEFVDNYRKFIQ